MNILQVLPSLAGGGVETGTVDLARALVRSGHKAVVVSNGGVLVESLRQSGAVHYRLPVHAKSLLTMLWCIPRLMRIIRSEQIDVVHARSRVPALIGYIATRLTGVPFVTTCHGYYSTHVFSRVMGWGTRVIVISQAISRHMREDFGVAESKIRLIYRGVDLTRFSSRGFFVRPHAVAPVIGLVGRITPLKGHRPFLYALEKVRQKFPAVKAVIVGEAASDRGEYFAGLKKLVRTLNLDACVEFLGSRPDVPHILRGLDLLVLPTTTPEAFGRVLIEAGAVGVPVVATRVGGIQEVIEHEKTGLLVDPNNPELLAQALITLLEHPPQAERYARQFQEKVRADFSLERMVDQTVRVYEEARGVQRIAVIKLGALGDVILCVPTLRALRNHFPQARIDVVVLRQFAAILHDCPYVDGIVGIRNRGWGELRRAAAILKQRNSDMLIDLQNNRFSHALGFLSGARLRYGYRNKKWGFLLNRGISDTMKAVDPVQHQFRVLAHVPVPAVDTSLELRSSEEVRGQTADLLRRNWISAGQRFIIINAFASRRWQTKVWILQRYAELADMISRQLHCRVVFTGTAAERGLVAAIMRHTACKPANFCGATSLPQFVALVQQAAALITVDSAAMHIAAGVGTPFVALFGPTDPDRHVPPGEHHAVRYKKLACAPCYRTRCFHRSCMRAISVGSVYDALISVLPKNAAPESPLPAG